MEKNSISHTPRRERLEQLDGLRGLCALSVFVLHLVWGPFDATGGNSDFAPPNFLKIIASFGHLGVVTFFVISGFVIGYTTPKNFTWKEAKNYILRRLIRLYPIYLVALILSFAIAENYPSKMDVVGHLLFLQLWLVPLVKTNGPLWTLHYEFMFYLLFVVIWKFKFDVCKTGFICLLFAILSAISTFHLFSILGYFTLWLSGLYYSSEYVYLKDENKILCFKTILALVNPYYCFSIWQYF